MLTDTQLVTAERLLLGMNQIENAVERLNELGRTLPGIPPISIRFANSPRFYGQFEYGALVNRMMSQEYMRRIELRLQARERLAA